MATSTQQVFKNSALRAQFIEPSIREGEFLSHSMLITEAAIIIVRYAPLNLVAPTVSGPFKIPGTIICNPGVWDGSPQPSYEYQWLSDGIEIIGETGLTMVSADEHNATTLTCQVTATSPEGTLTVVSSNGVYVEIVLPIRMEEHEIYTIVGIPNEIHLKNVSQTFYTTDGIVDLTMDKALEFSFYLADGMVDITMSKLTQVDLYAIETAI